MDVQTLTLIPYKILIVSFVVIVFLIGGILNVGADMIREQTEARIMAGMPIAYLSQYDVSEKK